MDGHVRRRHKRRLELGSPWIALADCFLRHTKHREEIILDRFNQLVVDIQVVSQRDMAGEGRESGPILTINVGYALSAVFRNSALAPGLRWVFIGIVRISWTGNSTPIQYLPFVRFFPLTIRA